MIQIDARGMSCPQPVLMTKNGIAQSPEEVEVIVDNTTARSNVERFLKHSGYKVTITEKEDDFILNANK